MVVMMTLCKHTRSIYCQHASFLEGSRSSLADSCDAGQDIISQSTISTKALYVLSASNRFKT